MASEGNDLVLQQASRSSEGVHQPLIEPQPGTTPNQRILPTIRVVGDAQESQLEPLGTGLAGSIVILAKTIVGAGAAALPFAFARLGILVSISFLLAVAFMTHFSIDALILGTTATGHASYPEVARSLLGGGGAALLEVTLVARCAGLIIVYLVVATDLLAGGHGLSGLLCDLAGSAGEGWCNSRRGVALAIALAVLLPLVTPKRLSSARVTSAVGLAAVAVWAGVTIALSGGALRSGKAHSMRWLPDAEALGGGSLASQAVNLLATLPVIATAYTCQMTVHAISRDLAPFSPARMSVVSGAAVSLCTVFFLAVGLGSVSVFGRHVPADVLEAFSESQLAPLVGGAAAKALGLLVRVGFLLCVLANVPMQMHPYRESLSRLLLGRDLAGTGYYVVTYVSVAIFYVVAIEAASIWTPLQLVGATAGAVIAFFVPAAVALKAAALHEPAAEAAPRYWAVNAWLLVAVGVVQVVTGVGAVSLASRNGARRCLWAP